MNTEKILRVTWEMFSPNIAALSSFQTQSIPLLHMISQICPELKIIFVDTGFHFLETLLFRDEVVDKLKLNLVVVKPTTPKCAILKRQLFFVDQDLCCQLNKVEPIAQVVKSLELIAMISGIRKDQTENRSKLNVFELQKGGLLRIHPMIDWTSSDIKDYIEKHKLPIHPFTNYGYTSISCAPCTRPVISTGNERAGRWANSDKDECGLHNISHE